MTTGLISVVAVLGSLVAPTAASTPESNNAALLYYQAFLLCPKYEDIPAKLIASTVNSGEVSDEAERYVKEYESVIELARSASKIGKCDWGIQQGSVPEITMRSASIAFLLVASGRVQAARGDYRDAVDDCTALRRFANHLLGESSLVYSLPVAIEGNAFRCIHHILNTMPPDPEILVELKDKLASSVSVSESLPAKLQSGLQRAVDAVHADGEMLSEVRKRLVEGLPQDTSYRTDDELVTLMRKPYAAFLSAVMAVLGGDASYTAKHADMKGLVEKLQEEVQGNHAIFFTVWPEAEMVPRFYDIKVAHETYLNALKVAVSLYLAEATMGTLPETLPNGLPKDPLSGQDFEYVKTEQGFTLRYRAKPVNERILRDYAFQVRRD